MEKIEFDSECLWGTGKRLGWATSAAKADENMHITCSPFNHVIGSEAKTNATQLDIFRKAWRVLSPGSHDKAEIGKAQELRSMLVSFLLRHPLEIPWKKGILTTYPPRRNTFGMLRAPAECKARRTSWQLIPGRADTCQNLGTQLSDPRRFEPTRLVRLWELLEKTFDAPATKAFMRSQYKT